MTQLDDDETTLEDTGDDEKWTVMNAAAGFLQEISKLIGNPVWTQTIGMVENKLNGTTSWKD